MVRNKKCNEFPYKKFSIIYWKNYFEVQNKITNGKDHLKSI